MKGIKKSLKYYMNPTPKELAKLWCEMDGDEQASFFSAIDDESNKWAAPFAQQLQFISDSKELTHGGKMVMHDIGRYGEGDKIEVSRSELEELAGKIHLMGGHMFMSFASFSSFDIVEAQKYAFLSEKEYKSVVNDIEKILKEQ